MDNRWCIPYKFLKTGLSQKYCDEVEMMHQKLIEEQPALASRRGPVLLHDNARPHASNIVVQKQEESDYETVPHPAYSIVMVLISIDKIASKQSYHLSTFSVGHFICNDLIDSHGFAQYGTVCSCPPLRKTQSLSTYLITPQPPIGGGSM